MVNSLGQRGYNPQPTKVQQSTSQKKESPDEILASGNQEKISQLATQARHRAMKVEPLGKSFYKEHKSEGADTTF